MVPSSQPTYFSQVVCSILLFISLVSCTPLPFTKSKIPVPSYNYKTYRKSPPRATAASENSPLLMPHIEVAFSPYGYSLDLVLKGIKQAQVSIYVAAYTFTSKPIAAALLEAYKRKVDIHVIADETANKGKYSVLPYLVSHGIPVRINNKYQIFHHKFMIIDDTHVQIGSFNYTAAAVSKNAENVFMLWNYPPIAQTYKKEWQALWNESKNVKSLSSMQ